MIERPTTNEASIPKPKVMKKKELTSERRAYKLMEIVEGPTTLDEIKNKYDFSSSDESSSDEDEDLDEESRKEKHRIQEEERKKKEDAKPPRVLVVKSVYGKTRPLTEAGKFSDRPLPKKPAPVNIIKNKTPSDTPQMPYVYSSNEKGIVLSRGQYLDLSEAID
eukprot:CAMPEP_0114358884 /NCGR_PEP_ID=MMETSP0101-20121206/22602_1 /TAXON_ID=38822 ORGANISM="Pteridomonas danica, Strain PT" /NCGR_SAMPLE_ID=MMETSP0101 /ASSEMBLY_ACC=CAM_ASM_000211 /LENGTH=163 /DNA_ID=CAMNT_0001502151 /DNA_START=80 /DNA_END=568 /DNA_ORIENTATION=+